MGAFVFGPSDRALFGFYHEPALPDRGNVLLCQPWGVEYQFAHRTMRFLAKRLARRGWHVLRFDYAGTGDSWGDTTVADLGLWTHDVARAADELRALGGAGAFGVVGLRLGGTLASMASGELHRVHRLVLWDPIVRGVDWIAEMDRLAQPDAPVDAPAEELAGRTIRATFREQVASIAPPAVDGAADRTFLLWTQEDHVADLVTGDDLEIETLIQPSPWLEDVSLGAGQIPVAAVGRIIEWMEL